jgi:hypothetical protein
VNGYNLSNVVVSVRVIAVTRIRGLGSKRKPLPTIRPTPF